MMKRELDYLKKIGSTWKAVNLENGRMMSIPGQNPIVDARDYEVTLIPGLLLIKREISMGRDMELWNDALEYVIRHLESDIGRFKIILKRKKQSPLEPKHKPRKGIR